MEKEKLIKLLTSKDKELRELALSYMLNNYKFPEIIYFDIYQGVTTYNLEKGRFKYYTKHILSALQTQVDYRFWIRDYELNSLLDNIITYNEKYK